MAKPRFAQEYSPAFRSRLRTPLSKTPSAKMPISSALPIKSRRPALNDVASGASIGAGADAVTFLDESNSWLGTRGFTQRTPALLPNHTLPEVSRMAAALFQHMLLRQRWRVLHIKPTNNF